MVFCPNCGFLELPTFLVGCDINVTRKRIENITDIGDELPLGLPKEKRNFMRSSIIYDYYPLWT